MDDLGKESGPRLLDFSCGLEGMTIQKNIRARPRIVHTTIHSVEKKACGTLVRIRKSTNTLHSINPLTLGMAIIVEPER